MLAISTSHIPVDFTSSPTTLVAGCVFTVLLLAACFSDVCTRRIPNRIAATLLVSGILYSVFVSGSILEFGGHSIVGVLVGFALWIPFYLIGWLGAGDVKLFAAAGAWLGPSRTFDAAILSACIGGILALGWMLRHYGIRGTAVSASIMTKSPSLGAQLHSDAKDSTVPYGVALTLGALILGWFPSLSTWVHHAAR